MHHNPVRGFLILLLGLTLTLVSVTISQAQTVPPSPTSTAAPIPTGGPPPHVGPSRLKVCATVEQVGGSDSIQSATIQATAAVQGANSITTTIADDGCVVFGNIPAGTYTITLQTTHGFTITRTIDIGAGEDGQITFSLGAPRPGEGLPTTGSGGGDSGVPSILLGLAGLGILAGGGLFFAALRRRVA
jgi:hypothetical protein